MNALLKTLVPALALSAALAACDSKNAPPAAAQGATPAGQQAQSPGREAVARGALLLDVRTPSEFAGGHLEGALNIPVDELAARKGEIAAGREVVVYCRSGRRSAIAADLLRDAGHKVIDIGTMSAW